MVIPKSWPARMLLDQAYPHVIFGQTLSTSVSRRAKTLLTTADPLALVSNVSRVYWWRRYPWLTWQLCSRTCHMYMFTFDCRRCVLNHLVVGHVQSSELAAHDLENHSGGILITVPGCIRHLAFVILSPRSDTCEKCDLLLA
ncbi:hypothetical protein M8818_003146 [Zalaria obscura]|uniref:Uncharacterized protein n=1 Tax=Zalaria obscura TaxID=2024903 RepID=A0ACC3SF63_9PEZI